MHLIPTDSLVFSCLHPVSFTSVLVKLSSCSTFNFELNCKSGRCSICDFWQSWIFLPGIINSSCAGVEASSKIVKKFRKEKRKRQNMSTDGLLDKWVIANHTRITEGGKATLRLESDCVASCKKRLAGQRNQLARAVRR